MTIATPAEIPGLTFTGKAKLVVSVIVVMVIGSCTSGPATSSSSVSPSSAQMQKHIAPELSALASALPQTATVFGSPNHGQWGNVVVVSDTSENMVAGPVSGATFNALGIWLSDPQNRDGLVGAGWDSVLSCYSSVNETDSGSSYVAGSEMIPLKANTHAGAVTVKTGQPSDTANNTTIDCGN